MKTINVAAAIIQKDGKILSCQRGYGEFKDGWEFPGGKLEPGETGEQAIVREIEEELEVTIGNLEYLCTVEHFTSRCSVISPVLSPASLSSMLMRT